MRMIRCAAILFLALLATAGIAQSPKARKKLDEAVVAMERRRPDRAEKLLRDAVEEAPDWAWAYAQLGRARILVRQPKEAIEAFQKMRELDSKNHGMTEEQRRQGMDDYGQTLARSHRYDDAVEVYTSAIKDDPEYGAFEYNLACTYSEKGDLDKALAHLKRAWELRGSFSFPDPRKDGSFRNWLNDPRFRETVRNMVI